MALLAIAASGATAQGYPTPSFDCANTTTAQELRICRSPELSELDGRHGALVERAVRAAPDRDKAVAEMDAWLQRVRDPCQTDQCLVDAYTAHIAEIERTVPPPKPLPAFTMPAFDSPVAKASPPTAPESVKASPPRVLPAPEPVSEDDEDEGDGGDGRDYAIAAAIALLAVVIAAAMRAGTRKRPRA
jgi:uncharacterized protein